MLIQFILNAWDLSDKTIERAILTAYINNYFIFQMTNYSTLPSLQLSTNSQAIVYHLLYMDIAQKWLPGNDNPKSDNGNVAIVSTLFRPSIPAMTSYPAALVISSDRANWLLIALSKCD